MTAEQQAAPLDTGFNPIAQLLATAEQLVVERDRTLKHFSEKQAERTRQLDLLLDAQAKTDRQIDQLTQAHAAEFQRISEKHKQVDDTLKFLVLQVNRALTSQQKTPPSIAQLSDTLNKTQALVEALITSATRLAEQAEAATAEQLHLKQTIDRLAEQTAADRQKAAITRTESERRWTQVQDEMRQIWEHLSNPPLG